MKQKTCKVAKTVLTLLLCAGLTAGSVPIDALAADVQSEQPVGGTETDTEAGTEGNTQSTGSVSDGNVVRKEREETGTESGAPQADSVSDGDGIALISLEASNTHIATYTGKIPEGITWAADVTVDTFSKSYSVVTAKAADGTSYTVEVVPEGIVYFIDNVTSDFSETTTEPYEAVKTLAGDQLINKVYDQQKTADTAWGLVDTDATTKKYNNTTTDKTTTGIYGNNAIGETLSYDLYLEAGTYTITSGHREWWDKTRPMDVLLKTDAGETTIGSVSVSKSVKTAQFSYTFTLDTAQTVTYTLKSIIVDEIHKAKNGGSQQGKALRFLKAPVKIGLSGTPMNKAEDLWNILTWLGVERRSFYSFKNAYCTMGGFGGYKVIGYKNLNDLNAELNTVMLRRKKEEVLDLPPKLYSTEYVELTTAQKKQYRDIKNGIVADMENILASVNPLNCTLRLRQLTSGNPNLTDDSPKLDRIKEMLEEEIIPNGHKAIIFSQWSTIAKDLGIELSEYDPIVITGEVPPEQRQRLVDNFQTNPHCKVAIGTIGAMGTGLTLNKASYVFFMDKAWNSGDNAQAEDRAHRIGTVGAVNVISMVAKGTIDEAVEDYLLENKDLIDRVVDGKGSKQDIKTILNKLLSI